MKVICEKYGLPYNTGSFGKQVFSMMKQVAKLSLPQSKEELFSFRKRTEEDIARKAGHEDHPRREASQQRRAQRRPRRAQGLVKAIRKSTSRARNAA